MPPAPSMDGLLQHIKAHIMHDQMPTPRPIRFRTDKWHQFNSIPPLQSLVIGLSVRNGVAVYHHPLSSEVEAQFVSCILQPHLEEVSKVQAMQFYYRYQVATQIPIRTAKESYIPRIRYSFPFVLTHVYPHYIQNQQQPKHQVPDRKSTRLNSSHWE